MGVLTTNDEAVCMYDSVTGYSAYDVDSFLYWLNGVFQVES